MVGKSLLAKRLFKRWVAICSLPCDRVDSLLRGSNFCVIECELGHTSYLGRELMMDCDVFLLLKFLVIVQFGLSLAFHISLAFML